MGFILRTSTDTNNPTLPGGVYGKYITLGRPIYYFWDGTRTRGILLIADGGLYGLDKVDSFEYKGAPLTVTTEWIFHRGTFTKQITPYNVGTIDTGTDVVTLNGHVFVNGDTVRFGVINGDLPSALNRDLKYRISDVLANSFKVKEATNTTYIDFANVGSGTIKIWKADAGFDDPDQGLPTFVPEVKTTLSNIAYVEFKLPTNRSSASAQPDWQDFRIVGTGRRLMDYSNVGAELGIVSNNDNKLSNVALEIADNMFVNHRVKTSRMHWQSWFDLKTAADVQIWQEPEVRSGEPPVIEPSQLGFRGNYYHGLDHDTFVLSRLETLLNFTATNGSWVAGIQNQQWSARFTAKIEGPYSELTTFEVTVDDGARLYIDGNRIIDKWPVNGVHTATYNLVAGQIYDLVLEFQQYTGPSHLHLYWSSASMSNRLVPASQTVAPSNNFSVRRYECHMAFPTPVEASEVHERLMERCPGWDWTEDEGKVQFLPPERTETFAFEFDRVIDDSLANFVKNTFVKKRRAIADRRNFLLFRYRNVLFTGFPFAYLQTEREALRDLVNGVPSNDPYSDLGVCTRSLAERMGEMQMVLKTDPEYTASISGGRFSGKIRKNQIIRVSYIDVGDNTVVDETFLVSMHSWGSREGRNDFNLVPLALPFYADQIFYPPVLVYAIDCGRAAGGVLAGWDQDTFFTGGSVSSTADTIVRTNTASPAPIAVYQSRRYGSFTYTFTGLDPELIHTVRMHFAEIVATANAARIFDISIQGGLVVNDLDIHALVGHDHSLVLEANVESSASGQIAITVTAGTGDPQINGIEIFGYPAPA